MKPLILRPGRWTFIVGYSPTKLLSGNIKYTTLHTSTQILNMRITGHLASPLLTTSAQACKELSFLQISMREHSLIQLLIMAIRASHFRTLLPIFFLMSKSTFAFYVIGKYCYMCLQEVKKVVFSIKNLSSLTVVRRFSCLVLFSNLLLIWR